MTATRRAAGWALAAAGVAGAVAAGIAGERAVARRVRRRPDPDAGSDFALPAGDLRTFPSHDGGTIATLSCGDGPPILLSHGVTLSMRTWVKQLDDLPKRGFRAIAFDHRGHGESQVGASGHSIDNLAEDLRSALDELDLRDVVLVGHSMGGVAVQSYVLRHPEHAAERVRGIVLLSTLYRIRPARLHRLRRLAALVTEHSPDFSGVMRSRDLGLVLARIGFGRDPRPSHVELTRQMIAACAPDTARDATRALFELDLTAALPEIRLPTLVVCGTADVLTPADESRHIAALVPGARLELFPGGGHMLMLERAAELDALIADFAREAGAASEAAS